MNICCILSVRSLRRPIRANRCIFNVAVKKSSKRSGFVIYSYFKDSSFLQQLKGMQSSKLGMGNGYHYQ